MNGNVLAAETQRRELPRIHYRAVAGTVGASQGSSELRVSMQLKPGKPKRVSPGDDTDLLPAPAQG